MRAVKSQIVYNGIELEVYQLPSGEYQLSKTQVGLSIEKDHKSLGRFLEGNSPEALPFKDFSHGQIQIEGNNATFHSIPLNVAAAYWTYWASKGNTIAQALVATSVVESLTRLCDNAFGNKRSEDEIQKQNVKNLESNEVMFTMLNKMESLLEQMQRLEQRTEKLNKLEENGKRHVGCLNVLQHEVDTDDYITARQFLTSKGLQNSEFASKFSRRSAQAMRVGKNLETLNMRNGQVLYAPNDLPYLEETLKSILGLD